MGMFRSTYHRLAEANIQTESSRRDWKIYTMYKSSIENKEEIKIRLTPFNKSYKTQNKNRVKNV